VRMESVVRDLTTTPPSHTASVQYQHGVALNSHPFRF